VNKKMAKDDRERVPKGDMIPQEGKCGWLYGGFIPKNI